jgi:hypothetical protein
LAILCGPGQCADAGGDNEKLPSREDYGSCN